MKIQLLNTVDMLVLHNKRNRRIKAKSGETFELFRADKKRFRVIHPTTGIQFNVQRTDAIMLVDIPEKVNWSKLQRKQEDVSPEANLVPMTKITDAKSRILDPRTKTQSKNFQRTYGFKVPKRLFMIGYTSGGFNTGTR